MARSLHGTSLNTPTEDVDGSTIGDVTDVSDLSQMILAVQDGKVGEVQRLIQSGCDVTQQDSFNWTSLNYSVAESQWDCFVVLSRAFCVRHLRNTRKADYLISAIENGDFGEAVKLTGRNKAVRDSMTEQERAAFIFLMIGHDCPQKVLSQIIKQSHDVNVRYHCGMSPLMFATIIGNHLSLEAILCLRPDLHMRDDFGKSATCYAVVKGCSGCLKLLLDARRNDKGIDHSLEKVAQLSVARGRAECLSLLLAWSQKHKRTRLCPSALLCEAAKAGSLQCLDILLSFGADASWTNEYGETALMHAVIKDKVNCVDRLLEHGVHVNAVDYEGNNALMHAVQWVRPECVPKLIQNGADVELRNTSFMTAICMACTQRDTDILNLILTSPFIANSLRIERHSLAFKLAAKFFNINALVLLMHHEVFLWRWMDDVHEISPELVAQATVRSGTRPGFFFWSIQTMTLLKLAFYYDNAATAQFLMANLYLSDYDVTVLPRDVNFIKNTRLRGSPQTLALLNQLCAQPWSLQALSFLAVSSSFNNKVSSIIPCNAPTRRKEMIQKLPIPQKFKDRLLFKTNVSRVCVDKWPLIGAVNQDGQMTVINFMSTESPFWYDAALLPQPCLQGQCANNDQGFRQRFQLLRYRN